MGISRERGSQPALAGSASWFLRWRLTTGSRPQSQSSLGPKGEALQRAGSQREEPAWGGLVETGLDEGGLEEGGPAWGGLIERGLDGGGLAERGLSRLALLVTDEAGDTAEVAGGLPNELVHFLGWAGVVAEESKALVEASSRSLVSSKLEAGG